MKYNLAYEDFVFLTQEVLTKLEEMQVGFVIFSRSIGLLLQVALPCLAFAQGSSTLILKGGTNADYAPQIDYTMEIFKPLAKKFGLDFSCNIIKR